MKSLCIRGTFLNKNNVIYNLQFRFRQQYFPSHALINMTENIRKAPNKGNIGCGVFVELQKTFDHRQNLITMGFVEFKMTGLNPICLIAISMYL